jgi:hypothetical protein
MAKFGYNINWLATPAAESPQSGCDTFWIFACRPLRKRKTLHCQPDRTSGGGSVF